MSNQLGVNPLVLDTANTTTVLINHRIKVQTLVFAGYTDAAHDFLLHDRNGKIVAQGVGATGLPNVEITVDGWINGLIMHTLDSGRLYVYYS